jgi:hypothetical protein
LRSEPVIDTAGCGCGKVGGMTAVENAHWGLRSAKWRVWVQSGLGPARVCAPVTPD